MKLAGMKFLIVSLLITSCGSNLYSTLDEGDVANEAAAELEKGNPDKAISLLEDALKSDPNNYVLISLLSESYSQKHGVSLLDIALAMAKSSTTLAGTNDLTTMWPALPDSTEDNLTGLEYAIELLVLIPDESKTPTDFFKLALLSVCSINLVLKGLDTDGDGALSTEELSSLSASMASTILTGLSGAATASAGASSLGTSSQKAASKITSINDAVSASEGSSSEEKLQSYFSK